MPRLAEGSTPTPEELKTWDNDGIWLKVPTYDRFRGRYERHDEGRQLEVHELDAVKRAVVEHGLIVEPINACMGFGFGIRIYKGTPAHWPGMDPEKEYLCCITSRHLCFDRAEHSPFSENDKDRSFALGWRLLSPLSHSEANVDLLQQFGFDKPKDRDFYDY